MNHKNVCVIGCGNWGKNLVRNFHQLDVLHSVYDSNSENFNAIKSKFDIPYASTDVDEAFRSKEINSVVIATPAVTHFQIVKKALEAGKDVFVEKPLSLNLKDAQDLIDIAAKKQKILMVDHLLQYHPAVIKLLELVQTGKLGKLQYIYSNRLNIGKLRNEENILWSFAPHDISVILALTGQMPQSVTAFGEAYLQDNISDTTLTTLTFRNRLKAHIYVSWLHPYKEQKLVVIGDKGMAVFNDMEEDKLVLFPHKIEWINSVPVAAKADQEIIPIDQAEPLSAACQHFLHCVQTRQQPKTDGNEALAVLSVLNQAQQQLDQIHA